MGTTLARTILRVKKHFFPNKNNNVKYLPLDNPIKRSEPT